LQGFGFKLPEMSKYNIKWLKDQLTKGATLKFLYFWGHIPKPKQRMGNWCFSQWYESPFEVEGVKYRTAEHWMMAHKASLFEDREIHDRIIDSKTSGEAKELGRFVTGFDDDIWIAKRYEIVVAGNRHKFTQNKEIGEYLMNTKQRVLVEASPVDTIWGVGMAKDNQNINDVDSWRGLNLLGFALMETRDLLLHKF